MLKHLMPALCAAVVLTAAAPVLIAAEEAPSIAQFLRIRTPGGVRLAPGGDVYTRDFPDGIFQLYKRAATDPVTAQGKKLTNFPDGLATYSISPDGKWLTLEAAVGGNENNQVWIMNAATEEITPVLQDSKVQYSVNAWLRDSSGFIYTANDPSPRDFYIYRFDIASKKSTMLLNRTGRWGAAEVSSDNRRLLVSEYRSISDSSIYVLDAEKGNLIDLTPKSAEGTSANTPVGFTTDELGVYFSSDFENGIVQLYSRDAYDNTKPPMPVLPGLKNSDLDQASINHERSLLVTVHNEEGYGNLRAYNIGGPQMESVLMKAPEKSVVGVSDIQGRTIVYGVSNANTPNISYAFEAPRSGQVMSPNERALTARMDSEPVDLTQFQLPSLIKFKSFDGRDIPAFLYLPKGASKNSPIPFVVNYHGGPEGQFRPGFDRTVQYLVSKGFGVMQPNVRGSTGYGREFHMLDNYKLRWDSVKDGVEAARWLVKEGYAKPGAIAAYGGSYGGFMAVATVIEGADVFGACVNVVGVVNLKTFLEKTSGYRQKLREVEYGPLSDPEFLLSVSPQMKADQINVPMLIAHGANDPRVPLNEAILLAVSLQKRGQDPELLFFPDEGHGFQKLENRILFSERMVKFLNRHIKDKVN